MGKISKSLKVFMLIFFILSVFQLVVSADKETKDKASDAFETKITYGFNKYYKRDRNKPSPIKIELKNNSEAIEGELELLFEKDRVDQKILYEAYTQRIDLDRGASKTIELDVPIGERRRALLRLVNEKGSIVFEQNINFERGDDSTAITVGVLSDSYDSLSFLGLINLKDEEDSRNKKMVSLADLNGAFPQKKELLKQLDIVLINDYDTQNLSKKQIEALRGYVEEGGVLLVGTGSKYQKSLKGLEELNYFSPDSTKKTQGYGGLLIASGEANGAEVLLKEGDKPLAYTKNLAKGNIIILGFDLGEESFLKWEGAPGLMKEIIKDNTLILTESDMGYEDYNLLHDMVGYIPNEKGINFRNIVIIIMLFLLFAGPINYIVLKKLDKSEYSWLTIPLISLAFTLAIYVVGLGSKFDEPMTNNAAILQLNKKGEVADSLIATGLFGFKEGDLSVSFNENTSVIVTDDHYANEMKFNDKDIVTKYSFNDGKKIDFMKMGRWESKTISTAQQIKDIDIKAEDFRSDDKTIKGKIKNNSGLDLKAAVLIYGGYFYELGDIDKKFTKEISLDIKELKRKRSGYRTYEIVENIYPWTPDTFNDKDLLSSSAKQNMLQQGLFNYFEGENDLAFIIAYSKDAIADDIELNGKKPNRMDRNLIMIPIELNYEKGQKVEIAEGVIRPNVESITNLNLDPYGGEMYGDGEVVYNLRVNDTIDAESISITNNSTPDVLVYLYNYKSEEWEARQSSTIKLGEEDMPLYYKEGKGLRMKFQANPGKDNTISQPLFTIKGVGK